MAVKGSSWRSRMHLVIRLIGVSGFMAALFGLFWRWVVGDQVGDVIALAGGGAALLALLVELAGAFRFFFSGRGAMGTNVFLQVALVVVLVVGVNAASFRFYQRFDWTEGRTFTLPEKLREDLGRLQTETDIVVFVRHSTLGVSGEITQDDYDAAAERKIVEKVKDLAEQFQELGPRFHVQVLDIQKKDYKDKLKEIAARSPSLARSIEEAPENSIFFQSRGAPGVQRLAFHDIYQLDRIASIDDNQRHGNLVLASQGVDPFAHKVLNIEEKKPRIAVAVVHEILGVDGDKELGMPGVKKVLASRGYEYLDVILKTWKGRPEPTILTHSENSYERLEAQIKNINADIKETEDDRAFLIKRKQAWEDKSLAEINKLYALVETDFGWKLIDRPLLEKLRKQGRNISAEDVTEKYRDAYLNLVAENIDDLQADLKEGRRRRDKLLQEKGQLNVENLAEQRRITDLRAKFKRMLADVDLLIVPRVTLLNIIKGERVPSRVHGLDDAQMDAIKDYLKSGRPALFCLGPANELFEDEPGPDALEGLLTSLGIQLPNQTILFNVEGEALAERNVAKLLTTTAEPPPVDLDWPPGAVLGKGTRAEDISNVSGPIRTSLKVAGHAFGSKNPASLKIRHPRPVYFQTVRPPKEVVAGALGVFAAPMGYANLQGVATLLGKSTRKIDESSVFLVSSSDSWNEDQPFPTEKRVPRFERPKADDPDKGTLKEKRRGPFPIGIAIETTVPSSWFDAEKSSAPPKVRLAVIGNGGVFMGETLTPMQEKLLLDVSNWLVGRDDLLAHEDPRPWKFPRVELSERQAALWTWGMWLGLPLVFLYLGMMVWLVRGVR
ncbi:MAG: hypothetical protein HY040_16355 [Planctomycetes bacterium]|nr:hypothetical protein [Planctomycetota bacterium]